MLLVVCLLAWLADCLFAGSLASCSLELLFGLDGFLVTPAHMRSRSMFLVVSCALHGSLRIQVRVHFALRRAAHMKALQSHCHTPEHSQYQAQSPRICIKHTHELDAELQGKAFHQVVVLGEACQTRKFVAPIRLSVLGAPTKTYPKNAYTTNAFAHKHAQTRTQTNTHKHTQTYTRSHTHTHAGVQQKKTVLAMAWFGACIQSHITMVQLN